MLTDPLYKVIPSMALPTIIAFLVNSVYGLADTYFVSHLGTNATAAVSVNASLDQIIMMAGSLLAIGANSYVARLLGAGEDDKAGRVMSTAFFIAMGFGAIVLVLGLSNMKPLVHLLGATESCEQYAMDYAKYVLLVAPLMACNFVMNQCLRAEGSATLSMIGMTSGSILNCVLDPIFIFGLDMGVLGASMATAISKTVSFIILISPYLRGRSLLKLSPKLFTFSKDIIWQIMTIGSSSFFRNFLAVVSAIVINNIAGNISEAVLAGIGVTNKVMMFTFSVILGFCSGFQPVAGFNWGAKRYDRVLESFRFASKAVLFVSVIMALGFGFFADGLIGLFSENDPELLKIGALCIRLQCLALPIHGWVAAVNMYCAGLGFPGYATLLSTTRQGTCFLPIAWPMAKLFGDVGVASVQAVADVLSLVLAVPVIIRINKIVRGKLNDSITCLNSETVI